MKRSFLFAIGFTVAAFLVFEPLLSEGFAKGGRGGGGGGGGGRSSSGGGGGGRSFSGGGGGRSFSGGGGGRSYSSGGSSRSFSSSGGSSRGGSSWSGGSSRSIAPRSSTPSVRGSDGGSWARSQGNSSPSVRSYRSDSNSSRSFRPQGDSGRSQSIVRDNNNSQPSRTPIIRGQSNDGPRIQNSRSNSLRSNPNPADVVRGRMNERRDTQPMIADKPDGRKGDGDGNANRVGEVLRREGNRFGDGDNRKSSDGNKGQFRDGDRRDNDGDRKGDRDGDRLRIRDGNKSWDNNRRGDGDRKGDRDRDWSDGDRDGRDRDGRDRDGRGWDGRGRGDRDWDRDHDHGDHWNKWNRNNRRHGWVHGHWRGDWDRRRWNNNWWWGNSWYGNRYFWGVSGWWWGPSFYNWGYYPYYNPYCRQSILIGATPYDYTVPFSSVEYALPEMTAAESDFDIARTAFFNMDYVGALSSIDAALVQTPGDPALHQFRALVLFARGEYEPAAATLHSILSVGPGWDWPTMRQFYPSVDAYTQQLRRLEDFRRANPKVSEARFLLAYHYMTTGYKDAAAKELQEVVAIEPKDTVAAQLLGTLTQSIPEQVLEQQQPLDQQQIIPSKPANPTTPVPPLPGDTTPDATKPPAAEIKPVDPKALIGKWNAAPQDGSSIELSLTPDSKFTWKYTREGKPAEFSGTYTIANNLLILQQSNQETMIGRVEQTPEKGFRFTMMGGPPDDPGLTFKP
ncbi:MAG: hypothetical protein AB7O26_04440 [Planctomycetaceae bacterium]